MSLASLGSLAHCPIQHILRPSGNLIVQVLDGPEGRRKLRRQSLLPAGQHKQLPVLCVRTLVQTAASGSCHVVDPNSIWRRYTSS